LESISADRRAQELLEHCLEGRAWPDELLNGLLDDDGSRPLFRVVVERLGDLFEPKLCSVYAEMFSEVIARRIHGLHAAHLAARYERVRAPRKLDRPPESIRDVFVLSRVTLGADVAITSVLLDAAKQRFPVARVWFAGPEKNWELFGGDPRLSHLPIAYRRGGTLDDRLSIWHELRDAVTRPAGIVIDPDSRLTQLGLLPICPEEDYYFFESRSYGGATAEPLSMLASRWAAETFGAVDARPYMCTGLDAAAFTTTVSFGVGENPEKRVSDLFEEEVLWHLPRPILVDKGAGGEEAERVQRAVSCAGQEIELWDGSFAGFAEHIARSRLYVGYDSAGGHAASAYAIPQISICRGFASERMFQRWLPPGAHAVRADADVMARELVRAVAELVAKLGFTAAS
jgi:hypothetical protein